MRGVNSYDQPLSTYNTTNSSVKDIKEDNRSSANMAANMMKDYFAPISS